MIFILLATGVADQGPKAALAAAIASSTSSGVQQGTFAVISPVLGL